MSNSLPMLISNIFMIGAFIAIISFLISDEFKFILFLPKFSGSLKDGCAPILTPFFLEIFIIISIVSSSPA